MKIKGIIDTHDERLLFTIPYIIIAVLLVVFLNLFAFLVWIIMHYFMDIYKYRRRNHSARYSLLKALHNCKIDFMFFFVGLSIELILSYYFTIAVGGGVRILGNILRGVPRLVGSVKAAEGIGHVAFDIAHHNKTHSKDHEKEHIAINVWDYTALTISALFLCLAFYILLAGGSSFNDIIDLMIRALSPFELH